MDTSRQALIRAAAAARRHAYAEYSGFAVGAALRTADGQIFTGGNVENASFGLTVCAERVAVFSAVAAGHRDFEAMAIVTDGGHPPCGACRQVLAEFCLELPIYLIDASGDELVEETRLAALLPRAFGQDRAS